MKRIIRFIGICLLLVGISLQSEAQQKFQKAGHGQFTYSVVHGKDTIPFSVLPTVQIFAKAPRHYRKAARRWNRLRNAVYVTYPYACTVASELKDVKSHLKKLPSKKARKNYLDLKEQEIKVAFGPKVKNLTIYEGKVLIKLIYRQTGRSCYGLIKKMKSGFSARLWQTVAFVFGTNLKTPYSKTKDADIEAIVDEIENNPYYYSVYKRHHGLN